MKTRMERVTEEIALKVLRNISIVVEPSLSAERLEENFYDRWPCREGSRTPMIDAMDAALKAAIATKDRANMGWDQEIQTWKTPIADAWDRVVNDTVMDYFANAERNFDQQEHLEGAETLTDAVRIALGYIAVARGWPHGTDDDLYRVAVALATGGRLPGDDENLYLLLEQATEEGMDLCGALGASMGRPDSVKYGLYGDSHDDVKDDAKLFARMTIDMAKRLAEEQAVTP